MSNTDRGSDEYEECVNRNWYDPCDKQDCEKFSEFGSPYCNQHEGENNE